MIRKSNRFQRNTGLSIANSLSSVVSVKWYTVSRRVGVVSLVWFSLDLRERHRVEVSHEVQGVGDLDELTMYATLATHRLRVGEAPPEGTLRSRVNLPEDGLFPFAFQNSTDETKFRGAMPFVYMIKSLIGAANSNTERVTCL